MPASWKRLVPVGTAAVLVVLPFVVLVALVSRYAINVPYWDEWEFTSILRAHRDGTIGIGNFWAQHNEHRIFFPNLVMFLLALVSHWDTRVMMAFSLLVAAASFGLLFALVRRTIRGLWPVALTGAVVSLVYFSPVQWENWLWGWQIEWFMNVAGLVLAVWALAGWRTTAAWKQITVAVAGATLATYSLGSGLMTWVACLPLLVFTPRLRKWTALWVPLAGAEAALYFSHYRAATSDGGVRYLLTHPGEFVKFLSVYLARPFFPSFKLAPSLLVTGLLVAMLLLGALYVWLRHRAEFVTVLPWLCVAAYSVLAGTATATGRLTQGPQQAESSRYTTISQLLAVAALVVGAKVLQLAWASGEKTVLAWVARFAPAPALVFLRTPW